MVSGLVLGEGGDVWMAYHRLVWHETRLRWVLAAFVAAEKPALGDDPAARPMDSQLLMLSQG